MASVRHSVHNEIAALGLGQKAFHAADAETALDHAAEPLHFGDHGGNLLRFRDARANRSFQGFDIDWPVTTTRHTSAVSCSKRITTGRNRWMMLALVVEGNDGLTVRKEPPSAKAIGRSS